MGSKRGYTQALNVDELILESARDLQESVEQVVMERDTLRALRALERLNEDWIAMGDAIQAAFVYLTRKLKSEKRKPDELDDLLLQP